MDEHRIGFIGAGRMATALATGLSKGLTNAGNIAAADASPDCLSAFTEQTGCIGESSNIEVVKRSDIVVLAVKPHIVPIVAAEIQNDLAEKPIVVSIAAGLRLETLSRLLGGYSRVVRVMPNTPCLIGQGVSVISADGGVSDVDQAVVLSMMQTVGEALILPESQLDAVTGLSGSGPAFVYQIIEALSDGGVLAGLPRAVASDLAARTVLGAAAMVLETGEHPGALKDAVASPGGTTIAGLAALESGGLRAALINAVSAASSRSAELAKPAG